MEKASCREAFGKALLEVGAGNSSVVVLVADVSASVKTDYFGRQFPERFYDLGIQEAGMIDVAVGLSLEGMIPFVNTFAGLYLRTLEQVRTCVAYAATNVKLIGGYCGVSDYKDGATHHSIMDVATMRVMPNMTVVCPADATEVRKLLPLVAQHDGPVYMRISRADTPRVFDDAHSVKIGKGLVVREGTDVTLVATGVMVSRCVRARDILAKEGISCQLIDIHTVKPLDTVLIMEAAEKTGAMVTAEEHSVIGGLGSAIAEVIGDEWPIPLERVGIADTFVETGPDPETLWDHYGMGVNSVLEAVRRVVKRKEHKE